MKHFKPQNGFRKNPFLGEEFVVWAENSDGADAQQSASARTPEDKRKLENYLNQDDVVKDFSVTPEKIYAIENNENPLPDKDFLNYLDKIIPGKTSYDPGVEGGHERVNAEWTHTLREIRGQYTFIRHFQKMKDLVSSPKFNPTENPLWGMRFKKIYQSFDNLKAEKSFKGNESLVQELRAKADQEADLTREEMIADFQKVIDALAKRRAEGMKKFRAQVKQDMNARLDYLHAQWGENPPKAYEEVASEFQAHAERVRDRINKMQPSDDITPEFEKGDEEIKEHFAIWQDLDRMEDKYRYAFESTAEQFNVGHLDARLNQAKEKKKEMLDPMIAKYNSQVNEAITAINRLIAVTPDEKERAGYIKTRENLLKTKNAGGVGEIFEDALTSKDPWQTEDPNDPDKMIDVEWKTDEFNYTPRKGLKHQIDMLKRLPLNEGETRTIALGINEAFDKYEQGIEKVIEENTNWLPQLIQNIKLQTEANEGGESPGLGWSFNVIAPYDLYRAYEIVSEWAQRRYKRAANKRIGEFGSQLLAPLSDGPIIPLRTLPNEFDKEVERSESEEVNSYKEVYENKDAWQIEEICYNTRNSDEFKACLYLLAEAGRLRWDKIPLVRQVNRFQNSVFIPEDYSTNLANISAFHDRMNKAFGAIWDFDTYKELKNKNSSAYDSAKKEYEQNCHEWAERPGGINKVIDGLLTEHDGNPNAKIDPILYEQIVDYAIVAGKMSPEDKLYYLIQGIARGILSPDRGSVLCSLRINDYPVIDYFGSPSDRDQKPTLQDIREVGEMDKDSFVKWFHSYAMTLPRVTQRVDKTLTQGNKLDHDDLTCFLGYMQGSTTENILKEHSGAYILPATGVQNATVGMMFFLDNMAENFEQMPRSSEQLARFVDSVMRFNGITMNHMYKDAQGFYRFDSNTLATSPRNSDLYENQYGRNLNTKSFLDTMGKHFAVLDDQFFGELYSGKIKTSKQAKQLAVDLKKKYKGDDIFRGKEIKTVDDLYKASGDFMTYLIEKHPNRIQAMFSGIKEEHAANPATAELKKKLANSKSKILKLRELYNSGGEDAVLEKHAGSTFT